MKFLNEIYKNEKQIAYFSSLIEEKKCAHAYILEAPSGGGKMTFAIRLAAALAFSCPDNTEEKIKKCNRILEGTSPDVTVLKREEKKKTFGVEAVRKFRDSVFLTPSELDFKFYIFDEADLLTVQAQNALLKVIEEPPKNVYIVFLCENSLSLLTTVRSRMQKVDLQVFTEAELAEYARENGIPGSEDEEKLQFAVRAAGGTIGMLTEVLGAGETEFSAYSNAKKVVELQLAKRKGGTYYAFLKEMHSYASTREELSVLCKYLLQAYGDLLRMQYADEAPLLFYTEEEAEHLSLFLSAETATHSFDAVNRIQNNLKLNTNLTLSESTLAIALWQAC